MAGRSLSVVLALVALFALPAAPAASSRDRYERALAKYQRLRLDGPRPTPLSQMRRAIAEYEAIARRYPGSGYADNALFQAGTIAKAAHRVYESDEDRATAVRLLTRLVREYPSSSLKPRAQKLLRDVQPTRAARAATPPPAARPSTPAPEMVAAAGRVPAMASLRDVKREIVGGVVRVTLEFDSEVAYHHEQLANPSRLYFDLQRATAAPALQDAVLTFDGPGPRHIRLGRPRNDTTRLVIDLQGVRTYSVFALYNPYRLAIDLLPTAPPVLSARAAPPARAPETRALAAPAPPPAPPMLSARTVATLAGRPASPVSQPVTALTRAEPERLSRRPLPHPLSDRPLAAARAVAARSIAGTLVPPLTGRALLTRNVLAFRAVSSRPVSRDVAAWLAAERAARTPPPLAKRMVTPPSLPAPLAPVPNALGGFSMARQLGLNVSRIVIDPGHGGHDPGTLASKSSESEVVLDVALRLEKLLLADESFKVALTRRTDVFIPLEERPAIANRAGADLFLSIHVNSSRNRQASGVETYFLNFADNPEAEAVAARENATASRSMHHLPDMVRAITLNNKIDESRDFAQKVQTALVGGLGHQSRDVRDRGVKQAPFVVLIGAGMPSVLAEIAFISNAEEASLLRNGSYRQRIAQSLFDAIQKYQRSLKTVGTIASQ